MSSAESFFFRHDLHVVLVAAAILGLGWGVARGVGSTPTKVVEMDGLHVTVPASFLAEPTVPGRPLVLRGEDAVTRVELRITDKPAPPLTVDSALEIERGQRYGQLYQRLTSGRVTNGGKVWLRTEFAYAFKPTPTHAPRLATAVEYAFPAEAEAKSDRLYVVTLHAPEDGIRELERSVKISLGGR